MNKVLIIIKQVMVIGMIKAIILLQSIKMTMMMKMTLRRTLPKILMIIATSVDIKYFNLS